MNATRKWMVWYWPAWFVVCVITFGIAEGYALTHHGMTLSEWVWRAQRAWPLFEGLYMLIAGGLAVHFFWTNEGLKKKGN
jgi:hypothetical protein